MDLESQLRIAGYLAKKSAEIEYSVERFGLSVERLVEYRFALISAAVTGKIDVWNHGPVTTDTEYEQVGEKSD